MSPLSPEQQAQLDLTLAAVDAHSTWQCVLLRRRVKKPDTRPWSITRDRDVITAHVGGGGNLGLMCSEATGLAVLDDDDPPRWAQLTAKNGGLDKWVTTGKGKSHFYTKWQPDLPAKIMFDGVKIGECQRGPGQQQVVAPPSIHPDTGQMYTWACDPTRELPTLPATWTEYLKTCGDGRRDEHAPLTPGEPAPVGHGDDFPELAKMFKERGWVLGLRGEKILVRCPWTHEHKTRTDDTECVLYPPSAKNRWAAGFKCQHGHCRGRDIRDVYALLFEDHGGALPIGGGSGGVAQPSIDAQIAGIAADFAKIEHAQDESPSISRVDESVILEWPETTYTVTPPFSRRLQECELSITHRGEGIFWSRVDVASFRDRGMIARELFDIHGGAKSAWRIQLETVCRTSAQIIARGSDPVALQAKRLDLPTYTIDPLLAEGQINAIWAPLSHLKGWLALVLASGLIQGKDPVPGLLTIRGERRPVLYLDWESNQNLFENRLAALGIPASALEDSWFFYRNMDQPLATQAPYIRSAMRDIQAKTGHLPVLIIDSWAMACGTDKPEGAGATVPAMLALRGLGSTSLILGHVTKKDSEKRGKRTRGFFGSIFNQNLARNNWEVQQVEHAEEVLDAQTTLYHHTQHIHFHRANDGRQDNPDLKLVYTFKNVRPVGGGDAVLESVTCQSHATFEATPFRAATLKGTILDLYRKYGPMTDANLLTYRPIESELAESWLATRRRLTTNKELVLVSQGPTKKAGDNVYGLPSLEADPQSPESLRARALRLRARHAEQPGEHVPNTAEQNEGDQ